MIKTITPEDIPAIISLAQVNQFETDEVEFIKATSTNYFDNKNNDELWFIAVKNDRVIGVIYTKTEPMANQTSNILMLLIDTQYHRQGYGKALISYTEEKLVERNMRLLIVETSSLEDFEPARKFYADCGYTKEAKIRDFYDTGNHKIIFTKKLKHD